MEQNKGAIFLHFLNKILSFRKSAIYEGEICFLGIQLRKIGRDMSS